MPFFKFISTASDIVNYFTGDQLIYENEEGEIVRISCDVTPGERQSQCSPQVLENSNPKVVNMNFLKEFL